MIILQRLRCPICTANGQLCVIQVEVHFTKSDKADSILAPKHCPNGRPIKRADFVDLMERARLVFLGKDQTKL